MIRRKEKKQKKGSPAWMTTFSDLMTLILVLFILLFSFSEIDATKFRMISNSFKGVFEESYSPVPMDNPLSSPVLSKNPAVDLKDIKTIEDSIEEKEKELEMDKQEDQELDELLVKVKSYIKENNLEGVIIATREERGIELVLQEDVLFDSGQAVVKEQAKPFLNTVADLIKTIPNMVEVEGHTDSQRIVQPSRYSSNWNLSGDRAANVVNYFINEQGISYNRFNIAGYADTRPVASNGTTEGRLQNRRVVIVILDSKPGE